MYKGRMDRRITIQRATETRDDFNNVVKTWSTLKTVWAEKRDVSDSERISSQEVGADITTRFWIEWYRDLEDLNPKDQLVYNGNTYRITAVKEMGRKQGMEITASARTDQ